MQPLTKPVTRRHGDEDDLYRRHHRELYRAVASAVSAPRELIEDACQAAWAALLRSQPERYAIVGWLRTVAIHEALSAIERRDARLERLACDEGGWQDITANRGSLDNALEAREALRILASLPERERETSRSWSPASATRRSASSTAAERSPALYRVADVAGV